MSEIKDENSSERILIIHTRGICYYSGSFFLRQAMKAFRKKNIPVSYLELSGEDADWEQLAELEGKKFRAILDINSKLPYLTEDTENGTLPLLDLINAPFYNWIVDHPLYHHPGLSFHLKHYHVMTIDRSHSAYVRKYYPWIKTADYFPIPGSAAGRRCFSDRKIDLLIPATYLPAEKVNEEWNTACFVNDSPEGYSFRQLLADVYDKWNPLEEPLEDALLHVLTDRDLMPADFGMKDLSVLMNYIYPVDRRVRYEYRLSCVRAALSSGTKCVIMGEGWDSAGLESNNLSFLKPVPIGKTYEVFADSKAVFDINPLFYCGMHDRVPSALLNGAECITTMSESAEPDLSSNKAVKICRDLDEIRHAAEEAACLKEAAGEEISDTAYRTGENYTWDRFANKFIKLLR